MSNEATIRGASGALELQKPGSDTTEGAWRRPDARRILQLLLATFWLLDGLLQLQSFFFTKSFGLQMISGMSSGNPSVIARPIHWSATAIGHHAVLTDSLFALAQIAIALAIAWRPTVKIGLGASIAWSIGVWWIGEGLGGVLNGTANPVDGAPGAVIIYALLAVLLWPRREGRHAPFIAARSVGVPIAEGLWLILWGSLAFFALLGTNRSSQHLHDLIYGEVVGEPGWLASLDRHVASMVDHRGMTVSVVLAAALLIVAIGPYLPLPFANATVVLAALIGAVFWLVGENLGALLTNGATDMNSGPLLVLLAAAYWRWPERLDPATTTEPVLMLEEA
ncbi:MAG TPA: hypothetical protein VK277_10835 [Acidimicrobiales bacterium]|nr:hypothetical protein [Acidimicrobiales bacterium]